MVFVVVVVGGGGGGAAATVDVLLLVCVFQFSSVQLKMVSKRPGKAHICALHRLSDVRSLNVAYATVSMLV